VLIADVERYLSLRHTLGFKLRDASRNLRLFARVAADSGDTHILASTALDWATESPSARAARPFAGCLVPCALPARRGSPSRGTPQPVSRCHSPALAVHLRP